jgi:hypothetical protein
MTGLLSLWPQEHISRVCLATLGMDLTAPFLSDMGLQLESVEELRAAFREGIGGAPWLLSATQADQVNWLESLDARLGNSVADYEKQRFWRWLRDTYTLAPADRPNWEMYEMFFFEWSVGMRSGQDSAGCFSSSQSVYEVYFAFIPSRRLELRIDEARSRKLSAWDEKIFSICGYSLSEDQVNHETVFDPFGVVEPTANRNYFQQFWEYLVRQLSKEELQQVFEAVRRYDTNLNSRLPDLVRPEDLNRRVR